MRSGSPLILCARQELSLAARSRWAQIFAAVFAFLAAAVAGSGYILSGGAGVQDFSRTASSLVQLVVLLAPLTSLVIGVLTLTPERGMAELLYAQPVPRGTILLGRVGGLFLALAAAQTLGLGVAGVIVFGHSGATGAAGYLLLLLGTLVLTAVFLGIAASLAAASPGRRARSLAMALIVWFAAVALIDLAALGVASVLPSAGASRLLIVTSLVNPVDAVRTGVLMGIEGTTAFGPASLALLRFTKGTVGAAALLLASSLLWIALPTWLAARRLSRADL
jgi:Cu-processing system permease protein